MGKMMRSLMSATILLINIAFLKFACYAQKQPLDNEVWKCWPMLRDGADDQAGMLSPSGNYFSYQYGPINRDGMLVIASIDDDFKIERKAADFPKADGVQFTANEDKVGYLFERDSMELYDLKAHKSLAKYSKVDEFKLIELGNEQFLILNGDNGFKIVALSRNKQIDFKSRSHFAISSDRQVICVVSGGSVSYVRLRDFNNSLIYSGSRIVDYYFDDNKKNLCALSRDGTSFTIWKYDYTVKSAKNIFSSGSLHIPAGSMVTDNNTRLMPDLSGFIFEIEQKNSEPKDEDKAHTWKLLAYTDRFISRPTASPKKTYWFDIKNCQLKQIFDEREKTIGITKNLLKDKLLITESLVNQTEFDWNDEQSYVKVYNLNLGNIDTVAHFPKTNMVSFTITSPTGNYLLIWDEQKRQYISYDVRNRLIRNITTQQDSEFFKADYEIADRNSPYGVAGWSKDEKSVYIYGAFDIWKFDLTCQKRVQNVTNGIGTQNKIRLRIAKNDAIVWDKQVLLSAFDVENKYNGYLFLDETKHFKLDKHCLGPYCYRDNAFNNALGFFVSKAIPSKAKKKQLFLVRRESATQSANLYLTSDFLNYRQMTVFHPESSVNWYRTRLINWTDTMQRSGKGVLYTPENLDTNRKYPVIIHYYEKNSDELYHYQMPRLSYADLSIPWYASNGYIVFVVDLQTQSGNTRKSIITTMSAAIAELGKLRWADVNNIGLQGHSNGGYETFLLITGLNFKAAQASSGFTNLVGFASHVFLDGTRQNFAKYGQTNIGALPWENPIAYIRNSPTFFALQVNTPLLIMHGEKDSNVPSWQGLEFYASLRRLKKPVWLLSYKDGDHELNEEDQLDFTVKQQEFFNHYLKGGAKPLWLNF